MGKSTISMAMFNSYVKLKNLVAKNKESMVGTFPTCLFFRAYSKKAKPSTWHRQGSPVWARTGNSLGADGSTYWQMAPSNQP